MCFCAVILAYFVCPLLLSFLELDLLSFFLVSACSPPPKGEEREDAHCSICGQPGQAGRCRGIVELSVCVCVCVCACVCMRVFLDTLVMMLCLLSYLRPVSTRRSAGLFVEGWAQVLALHWFSLSIPIPVTHSAVHCNATVYMYLVNKVRRRVPRMGARNPPPPFFRSKCRILLHFLKNFPGRLPGPPPPLEGHRRTRLVRPYFLCAALISPQSTKQFCPQIE